ncbi:hypothetical protein LJB42_001222 [Komagataella kurtzmanii]|nr:hypothetical protein LJB42_001222 [Komagataella kurtzmanii]
MLLATQRLPAADHVALGESSLSPVSSFDNSHRAILALEEQMENIYSRAFTENNNSRPDPTSAIWQDLALTIARYVYAIHRFVEKQLTIEAVQLCTPSNSIWKSCTNALTRVFPYLNFIIKNQIQSVNLSLVFFHEMSVATDCSFQYLIIFKDLVEHKVSQLDLINHSLLLRVVIYIHDKLDNVEMEILNYRKSLKVFNEVLLCYYFAIFQYKDNNVGVAIGLVNYGLLLLQAKHTIDSESSMFPELGPKESADKLHTLKSKLNISSKLQQKRNQLKSSKINKSNSNTENLESNIVASSKIHNRLLLSLPQSFQMPLHQIFDSFNSLNLTFHKENKYLHFQQIPSSDSIATSHLYNSERLPNGRNVPLFNQQEVWTPAVLQSKHDSNQSYIGKGTYY